MLNATDKMDAFSVDSARLSSYHVRTQNAPVAQMDRVQPSEGWGHWFESSRAHHISD